MVLRPVIFGSLVAFGVVAGPVAHAAATPAIAPTAPTAPASLAAMPIVVMPVPMSNGCYYQNCTQARQAGETDIPEGSAHYCSKLDRDGDGIACES